MLRPVAMRRCLHLRMLLVLAAAAATFAYGAAVANAAPAGGGPQPVTGGVFTTVDPHIDGTGTCLNGNPSVNCNIYTGKPFVWLNGGPGANKLGSDGTYFFAVLDPGGQKNPNDGSSGNLSDDYDCWQNREFTIVNGEVGAYLPSSDPACNTTSHGTASHTYDPPFIRLYPYADTSNPGGVYIMAVCRVPTSPTTTNGPGVDPKSCKYDAFKVPNNDTSPPVCSAVVTAARTIQITVQDQQSGIETITPTATNATVTLPTWNVGDLTQLTVTGTPINQYASASLSVTVTNVAGESSTCGATVPPLTDTTPPSCVLISEVWDGSHVHVLSIGVTVQDGGSGLKSVVATTATNVSVSVPAFSQGSTSPIVVTGTKVHVALSGRLALTVTDVAGHITTCDPVLAASPSALVHGGGVRTLKASKGTVELRVGRRALSRIDLLVNGQRVRFGHLHAGAVQTLVLRGPSTLVIRPVGPRAAILSVWMTNRGSEW